MSKTNVTYSVNKGLIELILGSTNDSKGDIWVNIDQATKKCINNLNNANDSSGMWPTQYNSWTKFTYPNTDIKIRIDATVEYDWNGASNWTITGYKVKVKNASKKDQYETFTHKQAQDYIDEVILGIK